MNREQKHQISKQIVAAIERTEYYRGAIGKMKRHPNTFYSGTFEIRLVGTRGAIWGEFSIKEAIKLLTKKLSEETKSLAILEKKIR